MSDREATASKIKSFLTVHKKHGFEVNPRKINLLFNQEGIVSGLSYLALKQEGGHRRLVGGLLSDVHEGIESSTKKNRADIYGTNEPEKIKPTTFCELVWDALQDTTLRILILAAFISLIVGMIEDPEDGWLEGVAILVAVVLVVSVTATNDYIKEKQFRKLSEKASMENCTVIRDGKEVEILTFDLLVGDLLKIGTGMIVPADGIVVQANKLKIDESSKTGESDLVKKEVFSDDNPRCNPFLLSGSKIEEGDGKMIVCAVGRNSSSGQTQAMLSEAEDETPLQKKLEVIAEKIGFIGVIVALFTFTVLLIYVIYESAKRDAIDGKTLKGLIESFIIAVTIVVVAVPEGLPLAVTLSLAYSVGKMKDENNLVRHLQACETMGGATDVCTDKTGTLTKNRMNIVAAYTLGKAEIGKSDRDIAVEDQELKSLLVNSFCLNSTAALKVAESEDDVQSGNRTECAMLSLAKRWGVSYEEVRKRYPDEVKKMFPFNSAWKWMATLVNQEDSQYVYLKGASEVVLRECRYIYERNGGIREMTEQDKMEIEENVIKRFAKNALRTIAVAYKTGHFDPSEYTRDGELNPDFLQSELVLLGIFGIADPIRDNVPKAVDDVTRAGVRVRMVTGDNIETAISIAKQCHILPANFERERASEFEVMEGGQFEREVGEIVERYVDEGENSQETDKGLDAENEKGERRKKVTFVKDMYKFTRIANELKVLARSSPKHKFILVTGIRQMENRVVAVTGDGANDAPALKKADVGFAMGITGTELAKEAADIILLDDNFASIVTALKWGRNIYDSIRKFIQFQLTVNLVALTMSFIGAVVLEKSPLTAVQMLWVNLIMDTFAALALATEPPSNELLNRKPYKKNESLIDEDMKKTVVGAAIYQLICLNFILFLGPWAFGVEESWTQTKFSDSGYQHFTLFFNTFVFMQVFNEINCRKLKATELNVFIGFFNNPLFLVIIGVTIIAQFLIVQLGGEALSCAPLTVGRHLVCLLIGCGSLISGLVVRLLPNRFFAWVRVSEPKSENASRAIVFTALRRDPTKQMGSVNKAMAGAFSSKSGSS